MTAAWRPEVWFDARRKWQARGLALVAGGLIGLGQAPFSLPIAVFLGAPMLIWLVGTGGWRRAAMIGWFAGLGHFALVLSWIVEPFLIDIARHGWMAPFALILMAGGMALFWALASGLAAALVKGLGPRAIALAALLALTGFLRAHIFTGFPWALPAMIWSETPVMQMLAFVGPHGLSFLTMLVAFLVAIWRPVPLALTALLLAGGWGVGTLRLAQTAPARADGFTVRLVQPNAPQAQKFDSEMMQIFYDRQIAATRAPGPVDVTIWPETAVPFLLGDRPELQAEIAASAPAGKIVLGIRRRDEDRLWYNSLAVLGRDGVAQVSYDKHHLVPFGEYFPLARWVEAVDHWGLASGSLGGFTPGPEPRLITAGMPPFAPLICYEAIFPHEVRAAAAGAEWLVQITNDAWFGGFSGPYQHLDQARARAIELGLPMARAANTGITAMIDPYGRVLDYLPLGVAGHLDTPLPGALPATLYRRWGDLPGLALALMALGLVAWRGRRDRVQS